LVPITAGFKKYREEVLAELTDDILAFWLRNVIDFGTGGFHGSVSGTGAAQPAADKGVIMATRVLWTFSRAYARLRHGEYIRAAGLMYRYLRDHFTDRDRGGLYWTVDHEGRPLDATKKFYGQAFAIYAFCEYSSASGDRQPLDEAKKLFALVERYGRDRVEGGYLDALGADWTPVEDTRLSDKDLNTPKTMNTNLHILEAYSKLASADPGGAVIEALENLVEVFLGKILMPNRHFGLFFDQAWHEVSGKISYGHDIEGSWLLAEAAERTGRASLAEKTAPVAVGMAKAVLEEGLDAEGGVLNEREADGSLRPGREWWMQAEAMVGFFNAYEMTGSGLFLEKSLSAWEYCKKRFLRPGGEWYYRIDEAGAPDTSREIAGMWKCPYHTGRACLEIAERTGEKA
jgi:mannobiose 2-epimerase